MATPDYPVEISSAVIELFIWFWDKYGHELSSGIAKNAWHRVDWKLSAKKYSKKIMNLYGSMRILGKNEPVSIRGIYTGLQFLDKFTTQLRYESEELNRALWNRQSTQANIKRVDGLEVVKKIDQLFILGRPGAGKSTFLKNLALETINGFLPKHLPVMIELRDFAGEKETILDYIIKQFDVCDFPDAVTFIEKMLNSGNFLVLFDGLDEVPIEQDKMLNVIKGIEKFVEQYDKNKFVITCRIAASDYKFKSFTYVELAEFTKLQAQEFTKKWFLEKTSIYNSFWCDLEDNESAGLLEMTRNPLLLTLLCLNYESTQSFPYRRVEVYEEALDALLKTWDTERGIQRTGTKLSSYGKLSLGHKKEMFAELAASGFENGQLVWKEDELSNWLAHYVASIPPEQDSRNVDGQQILKDIEAQHAILIEQSKGQYSFAHLTYQEYYTASYIVAAGTRSYKALVYKHLNDSRWYEVFLLTSSKLPKMHADIFFEFYIIQLDKTMAKSDELHTWITWLKHITEGSYKDEFDALAARILLAISSTQFKNRNEEIWEYYFCKICNIEQTSDFKIRIWKSPLSTRIIRWNPNFAIDYLILLLYFIVKDELQGLTYQSDHYRAASFLTTKLVAISNKQQISKDHQKQIDETKRLFDEWKFSELAIQLVFFLQYQRGWILSADESVIQYVRAALLCFECLELSRVSNRLEIYKRLFE